MKYNRLNLITYLMLVLTFTLVGCGGGGSNNDIEQPSTQPPAPNPPPVTLPQNNLSKNPQGDISYITLTNRDPDCGAYVGTYQAHIYDSQQQVNHQSQLTITASATHCNFSSNNIPNHDVGTNTTTGKDFASAVQVNSKTFSLIVPRAPTKGTTATYVTKIGGMLTLNGILLNGVDLDMDSAFCYHPDINAPLNVGLGSRTQCGLNADWYAVPANNPSIVTLDNYTGHAFDGRYHYHGDNHGLSHDESAQTLPLTSQNVDASGSPVIGFAPDGFPIYGHYYYDQATNNLKKATSSWRTYTSERVTPAGASFDAPSISTHPRGMFVEDWHYVANSGVLDECNGMTDAYGNYGYYYTDEYPYGPICSFGQPDSSFTQEASAFLGL